jgi:hypothetical protein
VTILSLWWWAITAIGVLCIIGVTSHYRDIARAQNNADAIALAYVSGDSAAAQNLADALHVSIVATLIDGPQITVSIRQGPIVATAHASRDPDGVAAVNTLG